MSEDASAKLKGFKLLFACSVFERWMLDGVTADLRRGGIPFEVFEDVDGPEETRWQVWRSAKGWIEAHQREADLILVRGSGCWAYSEKEIDRERRLERERGVA